MVPGARPVVGRRVAREEGTAVSTRREIIENTITDMVSDLLYYRRKEDSTLPVGAIDAAVREGEITIDDMVTQFRDELIRGLVR